MAWTVRAWPLGAASGGLLIGPGGACERWTVLPLIQADSSQVFALAPLCASPFEIAESVAEFLEFFGYLVESDEDRFAFRSGQRQSRLLRIESPFDLSGEL